MPWSVAGQDWPTVGPQAAGKATAAATQQTPPQTLRATKHAISAGWFGRCERTSKDRDMPVYFYDPPARFVAGTVGQPGERTFYLQASGTGRVTSVTLEKQQVTLLAERLDELLDEILRRSAGKVPVPAVAPAELQDDAPLELPLTEDFRVGSIALAWAFAQRALKIVAAGRPPCPLCGLPLDTDGHVCPRQNGHRAGSVI